MVVVFTYPHMQPRKPAKPPLGRLEKINLEDYWQTAADFLTWQAEADNLELLGEALGLELDALPEASQPSDFYFFCREATLDRPVLMACQLEEGEIDQVGVLLTAAAEADAAAIVWVARCFEAESQVALDWLNQIAPEVDFWAVSIELWRIGKKAMAANFIPICSPYLEEVPDAEEVSPEPEPEPEPEPLSETEQENLDFWSGLSAAIDQRGSIVKSGAASPQIAMSFAIGRAGFRLWASINRDHHELRVELRLLGEDAHPHFCLLAYEQDLIHDEMGFPLGWDDADEKRCAIYYILTDIDIGDRDRWPDDYRWLCETLERFYEVFSDRIKTLNANDYEPLPDYSFDPRSTVVLPVDAGTP